MTNVTPVGEALAFPAGFTWGAWWATVGGAAGGRAAPTHASMSAPLSRPAAARVFKARFIKFSIALRGGVGDKRLCRAYGRTG